MRISDWSSDVCSSDLVPKEISVNQGQIAEALAEPVATIVSGVRLALENTAPELAADICDQGIVLTGGGALLSGLDEVLREATGLPVTVAEEPLTCVALGTGRAREDPRSEEGRVGKGGVSTGRSRWWA